MNEDISTTSLGRIAEDYIVSKLKKEENQNVVRVDFTNDKVISPINTTMIGRIQNMMIWEEIDTKRIKEVIKIIKDNILGFPDLVCIDQDTKEISFVEVKSNSSHLDNQQKNTIHKLRELGFKVEVRYVDVDCNVSERSK